MDLAASEYLGLMFRSIWDIRLNFYFYHFISLNSMYFRTELLKLQIYVAVKREPDLCAPESPVHRSQGPLGLGYGPPNATVWLLRASKAIARGFPPMAVARDMTSYASYQISSRCRMRCYITTYIMYRWYKSGCNPVLGSSFAFLVARDLSTTIVS